MSDFDKLRTCYNFFLPSLYKLNKKIIERLRRTKYLILTFSYLFGICMCMHMCKTIKIISHFHIYTQKN